MRALVIKLPEGQDEKHSHDQLQSVLNQWGQICEGQNDLLTATNLGFMSKNSSVEDVIILPPEGSLERDMVFTKIANVISEGIDVPEDSKVDVEDRVDIAQTIVEELTE
jgi:hypothetical protein